MEISINQHFKADFLWKSAYFTILRLTFYDLHNSPIWGWLSMKICIVQHFKADFLWKSAQFTILRLTFYGNLHHSAFWGWLSMGICIIQHFEDDFLWEVSLKILNSGINYNSENLQPWTLVCLPSPNFHQTVFHHLAHLHHGLLCLPPQHNLEIHQCLGRRDTQRIDLSAKAHHD